MNNILDRFVCVKPFTNLEIHDDNEFLCCPSWCSVDIKISDNLLNNWQSPRATSVRRSMLDGSYEFCNAELCPSLNKLKNYGMPSVNFLEKNKFLSLYRIKNEKDVEEFSGLPEEINFTFDRSCNLKCPSCRSKLIPNDDIQNIKFKNKLSVISKIDETYAKSIKTITITGSGEPFYSKVFRDYIFNFNGSKYPNLENIIIITNGVLLDQDTWNKVSCKNYIKNIQISIDAASKETYENIVRLNGDWDRLISNIRFISTIESLDRVYLAMVVSKHNYKEMFDFYQLFSGFFKNSHVKYNIVYRQIVYWSSGGYSKADIDDLRVFDPRHKDFNLFKKEFKKILGLPNVNHNFHSLIKYLI